MSGALAAAGVSCYPCARTSPAVVAAEPDRARMSDQATAGKSEVRDGMQIDWDVPIPMDDGIVLRADVFRPCDDGKHPVILSYGAFGKGLAFQEGNKSAWD